MAASMENRRLSIMFVYFTIFLSCLAFLAQAHGHDHGHHHGHDHAHGEEEAPGFKYSQQANEHVHSHSSESESHGDHGHDHGHTHGDHGHDHGHTHDHGEVPHTPVKSSGFNGMMWAQAIGATFLVCCAPVLILIFIPLDRADEHQPLLKVLLSFASGGLLGDAFLHLIPHAISPHDHTGGDEHAHSHSHDSGHSHSHSHDMSVGLWVLAGIVAFLMVEKFVRYVKGGHGHSHGKPVKKEDGEKKKVQGDEKKKAQGDKKKGKKTEEPEDIKVAGYLNLAADFTHNFTDGLAIGASYLAGTNIGIITTITILLHEVPHEIGDFAILVQSGCSKRKAMMLQFSTAIGAMLGTLVSLAAGGIGSAAVAWILPFTAGGFIYIATVAVIPELLGDSTLWQSFKEIVALLTGVGMMVIIAELE